MADTIFESFTNATIIYLAGYLGQLSLHIVKELVPVKRHFLREMLWYRQAATLAEVLMQVCRAAKVATDELKCIAPIFLGSGSLT